MGDSKCTAFASSCVKLHVIRSSRVYVCCDGGFVFGRKSRMTDDAMMKTPLSRVEIQTSVAPALMPGVCLTPARQ